MVPGTVPIPNTRRISRKRSGLISQMRHQVQPISEPEQNRFGLLWRDTGENLRHMPAQHIERDENGQALDRQRFAAGEQPQRDPKVDRRMHLLHGSTSAQLPNSKVSRKRRSQQETVSPGRAASGKTIRFPHAGQLVHGTGSSAGFPSRRVTRSG